MTLFAFKKEVITLSDNSYTPGTAFALYSAPLTLSVNQQQQTRITKGESFTFYGSQSYQPASAFKFKTIGVFEFPAQAYTPGTLFKFPWVPASEAPATPTNTGQIVYTLDDVVVSFTGVNVRNVGAIGVALDEVVGNFTGIYIFPTSGILSYTLEDVTGQLQGAYDPNVHRPITHLVNATEQDAHGLHLETPLVQKQSNPMGVKACSKQDKASSLFWKWAITQDQALKLSAGVKAFEDDALPVNADKLTSVQTDLTPLAVKRCGTVDDAQPVSDNWLAPAQQLTKVRPDRFTGKVEDAGVAQHHYLYWFYTEGVPTNDYTPVLQFALQQAPPFDDGRLPEAPSITPTFVFSADPAPAAFVLDYWAIPGGPARPPALSQNPHIVFNGMVVLAATRTDDQIGGVRHFTTAPRQSATRAKIKRCVPVDQARKPPKGKSIIIHPPLPPPSPPPGHETITIPTRTVYFMQHNITVTLEDLTPIGMKSVNLSLNADSYAWAFSGALIAIDDLQHVQSDTPVKLIVTINSYVWHVLIERIEHSRKFAEHSITLTGRGLTAYLSAPYYNPYSITYNSLLSLAQIATLQLPPSGWTLNWDHVDWNIPAGAYSHVNQTPMEALAWIAKHVGAMLIPARDAQTITVKPRYPYLPWQFSAATPDVVIPDSAITGLVQRPIVKSDINGVYVHGGVTSGILSWCRLNGTAGDRLAPTESNNLMTDIIGTRALGERTLAAHAVQPLIQSISLPLDGVDMPLIELGQLIKTTLDSTDVYGIVNAVAINAELGRVSQTIQIGEETPNAWSLFKNLLPSDPLLVATLAGTDGVTSVMTLLDGGVVKVRGTGDVNSKYYIRSGKIDGDAPNLALSEVVI